MKIDANNKKIWKSKTIITAAIMMITVIIDAAFNLQISESVNNQLSQILTTNESGEVTKINFVALFSLFSMIVLRLFTKDPIKLKQTIKDNKSKTNEVLNIDFSGTYKKEKDKTKND